MRFLGYLMLWIVSFRLAENGIHEFFVGRVVSMASWTTYFLIAWIAVGVLLGIASVHLGMKQFFLLAGLFLIFCLLFRYATTIYVFQTWDYVAYMKVAGDVICVVLGAISTRVFSAMRSSSHSRAVSLERQ